MNNQIKHRWRSKRRVQEEAALFGVSSREFDKANPRYKPGRNKFKNLEVNNAPDTRLKITSTTKYNINLVMTINASRGSGNGSRKVAGKQTLNTTVVINFGQILPIYWMASVLKNGEISPNFSYHLYSSDKDQFTMSLNKEIEIERTVNGEWKIPHFDSSKYKVNVGFGIGKKIIAWGYVLSEITPGQSLTLSIGGYAILMSDGQLRIGDSVKSSQDKEWEIKIGKEYLLNFDDCGRGKLTSL